MRLVRRRPTSNESAALVGAPPPHRSQVPAESPLDRLFREAYHRLHGRLLDHAERYLDRDTARDAEAQAMADVWYRWSLLTPEQRSDRYFFRALRNSVLDVLRARRAVVSLEDAEEELERQAARSVETPTRGDTLADVLDLALAAMPPRRREVFLLVKEERFTYPEAAEVLGLSIGTINTHMRLATKDLRTAFTRAGFRIESVQPARLPSPKGEVTND